MASVMGGLKQSHASPKMARIGEQKFGAMA